MSAELGVRHPGLKIVSLSLFMAVTAAGICSAEQIEAVSSVKAVTVFPDCALVSRIASVKVPQGEHAVAFSDIIPEIEENSIRVSAKGAGEVTLLGAMLKQSFLTEAPVERVRKLQEKIRDLNDGIKAQQDLKAVLRDQKSYIDSVRLFSQGQIPKDMVTKVPSPAELEATLKFLEAKLKENSSAAMESDLKIRDLENQLRAAERELAGMSAPVEKRKRSIVVNLESAKPGPVEITVSYLVYQASWRPVYDTRAFFEKQEVDLSCYAMVKQTTGEPWKDAEFILSTARPSVSGELPAVEPWILRPYEVRPMQAQRRHKNFRADAMMDTEKSASFEQTGLLSAPSSPVEAEEEFALARDSGTAVVYSVKRRVTVNSDGTEYKLPVFSQSLKARFKYTSYPRALAQAYLVSRVKNSSEYQFLPGQASVFLGNDYVGASTLKSISPQEEFDLYLGADENVKVTRERLEKKIDETIIGGIPSPNKIVSSRYRIKLENYKQRQISVELFESVPAAENDKIKVKTNKVSEEPKVRDWEGKKGVWLWEIDLAPGQKKEITYSFSVEYPRDMIIEGL